MNTRQNDTNKIKGRGTYQKRRPSEKDVDQPDGSLIPEGYESPYNSLEPYETPMMDDNDIDESDFSYQHNEEQALLPIKRLHVSTINRSTERAQSLVSDKKQIIYPARVDEPRTLFKSWRITVLIPIIVALFILRWQSPANDRIVTNHILQFSKDLKTLGIFFNLSKDSLLKIKVGVNTIHDNESSGSFTILYNSGANNFHKSKFNEMLKGIANATAKYLRNGNGSFIELESNNLKMATHEELMNSYDSTLLEAGVMLVKDLDNLPTNLAMAFHYFCDEYEPLVKKTAIFFTIDKQKCSFYSNSEPHKWIEKCLADKWKHMREDSISPLLARVVEIVVEI